MQRREGSGEGIGSTGPVACWEVVLQRLCREGSHQGCINIFNKNKILSDQILCIPDQQRHHSKNKSDACLGDPHTAAAYRNLLGEAISELPQTQQREVKSAAHFE